MSSPEEIALSSVSFEQAIEQAIEGCKSDVAQARSVITKSGGACLADNEATLIWVESAVNAFHFYREKFRKQQPYNQSNLELGSIMTGLSVSLTTFAADEVIFQESSTLEGSFALLQSIPRDGSISCLMTCSKTLPREDGPVTSVHAAINNVRETFLEQGRPSKAVIRTASLVLFLLLARHRLGFSLQDLHSLITTVLVSHPGSEGIVLPDLLMDDILSPGHLKREGFWHSVSTSSLKSTRQSEAKTLVFPSAVVEVPTKYFFMERHKPHGSIPHSNYKIGVWGARGRSQSAWTSLLTVSDHKFGRILHSQLSGLSSDNGLHAVTRIQLQSQWIEVLPYVYYIGLNNTRLIARDILKIVTNLKFENAANPVSGAADACLMYMHNLEHHQHLLRSLHKQINERSSSWSSAQKPPWIKDMNSLFRDTKEDVQKVYDEARTIRTMIIEQHSLSQARNLSFLTILATFFVPLSAVATFFGMNTKEINDSAWPILYYIAAAVPLTVVSVIVPLTAFWLLDALLRLASMTYLRRIIYWTTTFYVLFSIIYGDIVLLVQPSLYYTAPPSLLHFLLLVFYSVGPIVKFMMLIRKLHKEHDVNQPRAMILKALYAHYKVWPLVFISVTSSYITLTVFYPFPFADLIPILVYFLIWATVKVFCRK